MSERPVAIGDLRWPCHICGEDLRDAHGDCATPGEAIVRHVEAADDEAHKNVVFVAVALPYSELISGEWAGEHAAAGSPGGPGP